MLAEELVMDIALAPVLLATLAAVKAVAAKAAVDTAAPETVMSGCSRGENDVIIVPWCSQAKQKQQQRHSSVIVAAAVAELAMVVPKVLWGKCIVRVHHLRKTRANNGVRHKYQAKHRTSRIYLCPRLSIKLNMHLHILESTV